MSKKNIKYLSQDEAKRVIEIREPIGLFYTKENGCFIAVDNSTGDAWTEEFEDIKGCLNYLLNE